jgi:ribosome assembly protein YihI (activator of Der GTPase)
MSGRAGISIAVCHWDPSASFSNIDTMRRFWDSVIRRILQYVEPRDIVEIGSERGKHTTEILQFCRRTGCRLHVIEPSPRYDVDALKMEFGELVLTYQCLSLDALPLVPRIDVVLIDGDHNWYTVSNELKLIERKSHELNEHLPVILLHDVGWPYGRRDVYYDPSRIPEEYRQEHKQAGVLPGASKLVEGGLNRCFKHAVQENTPRNGVLTAVEDFLKEAGERLHFQAIEVMGGLGILCEKKLLIRNQRLDRYLKRLRAGSPLGAILQKVEEERIRVMIAYEDKYYEFERAKKTTKDG